MTDPPLGRCPVHPERNAWRVCGRCGRFLCAVCSWPTGEGAYCESCFQLLPKQAEGFSGFMMLAFVGLVGWPTFTLNELFSAAREPGFRWSDISVEWVALNVPVSVLALCVLPLYALKRRIARTMMLTFYGGVTAVAMYEIAQPGAPVRVLIGLAWLGYFATSARVKRVLVK